MKAASIAPGSILRARPLTPEFLQQQWSAEVVHPSASLNLRELVFNEDDWASWEWNACEALHLNNRGGWLGNGIRTLFDQQLKINFHLLHAYRHLVSGWRQWDRLAHVTTPASGPKESRLSFLLLSAQGRLEQAEIKQESMQRQKHKFLQAVSIRQHRLFQQLTALIADLNPVIAGTGTFIHVGTETQANLESERQDIYWHVKELEHTLGPLENQPAFLQRARVQRREINRLLGVACQYHASHLKTLLKVRSA